MSVFEIKENIEGAIATALLLRVAVSSMFPVGGSTFTRTRLGGKPGCFTWNIVVLESQDE